MTTIESCGSAFISTKALKEKYLKEKVQQMHFLLSVFWGESSSSYFFILCSTS